MEDGRIYGFEPVWRSDARVLILGSMPSVESLNQGFYYAHPRNAFWPMMARILGAETPGDVQGRRQLLIQHKIALWDTAASCLREGSLDSAIRSARANDFEYLYKNCPDIRCVLFNGAAAEQLYRRLVGRQERHLQFRRMPSTSPAYTIGFERKLAAWEQALKEVLKDESL